MKKIKIEFNEDEIIKLENCIEHVESEVKRIKNVMNLNNYEEEAVYLEKFMQGLKETKEKIHNAKRREL